MARRVAITLSGLLVLSTALDPKALDGKALRAMNCAACAHVARAAMLAADKPGVAAKLKQKDGIARYELISSLCTSDDVAYAYPRRRLLEETNSGKKALAERLVFQYQIVGKDAIDKDALENKTKVEVHANAQHASELPETIVRGKEKNGELMHFCEVFLEEHDEVLGEKLVSYVTNGDDLPRTFCVEATKECTMSQLTDVYEAAKPKEPTMPEGMREEDWPAFRKKNYDENGNPKMKILDEEPPVPRKKKRKSRKK